MKKNLYTQRRRNQLAVPMVAHAQTPSALELLGSTENIRNDVKKCVFGHIANAISRMEASGFCSTDLGEMLDLDNPRFMEQVAQGAVVDASLDDVMAVMACLEISIETVLPYVPKFTPEQRVVWLGKMKTLRARNLAASNLDAEIEERLALNFFVRLEALKEAFR